jgi:desulfoferrodoxin-like iron-binding protein
LFSEKAIIAHFCPVYIVIRRGGEAVGVQEVNEKYRCNICGNEVIVTKVGGGTLVCCGEDMELIS